jgi:Polyphosphate kinase 2 (PPK2)
MTFSPKGLGANSQSTGIFRKFSEHGEQNAGHCVCAGLAFFAHSIRAIAAARLLFPSAARLFDLSQRLLRPMRGRSQASYGRWYDYSRARDLMFRATSSKHAPWHIIRSDDKRRVRLNCIAHFLKLIPYKRVQRDKVKLPKRSQKGQ